MEVILLIVILIIKTVSLAHGATETPQAPDIWALFSNALILLLLGWVGINMRKNRQDLIDKVKEIDKELKKLSKDYYELKGRIISYLEAE